MIGESLIIGEEGNFRVKTLYQFVKEYEAPESFIYTKLIPLRELLENTNLKANRQAILMFGVIIRVLTDYYDPKHRIVRSRNLFTNKLDDKNKKDLQYRIFVDYLKFIKNSSKYYKSDHSESVQNNKPKNSLEKKNLKN
jgi:hypothetical protein